MRRIVLRFLPVLALFLGMAFSFVPLASAADELPKELTESEIQELIKKFVEKETIYATERQNYVYRQAILLEEMNGGAPSGNKYEIVIDLTYDEKGRRQEVAVRAPVPNLKQLIMTPRDEEDLRSTMPFAVTSDEIANYQIDYLGRDVVDELKCYLFSVKPTKMAAGKRYFQGIVWVDAEYPEIVKTYGRSTGVRPKKDTEEFIKFTTYRDLIDGKYRMPVLTAGDDLLQFDQGNSIEVRLRIKYSNYQRFNVDIKTVIDESTLKGGDKDKKGGKKPK
jgi:hypothetical protein